MITSTVTSGGAVTTTNSAASGGGTGASGSSITRVGYLWPSSGAYPTTMTPHREAVTDSGTVATVTQGDAMTVGGTVVGLAGYIYGTTGGDPYAYTWTLYKNGTATSLTTSTKTTVAANSIASGASIPFVAGDVLQVFSMASSGATPQATKATLTIQLT